jgi:hypothetical protein
MLAAGIPKATIALELGAAAPTLQIGRGATVNAQTARQVAQLHDRWTAGEWTPVRRDCHGNTYPTTPPPPPVRRGGADVSDLYLELADILDERRAQAEWRQSAACRGRPTWMWFPNKGDRETQAAAQLICRSCIVREQCRGANLDQPAGIFAAMTGTDRAQLRQVEITLARAPVAECNSNAGYHRHLRDGEDACPDCLAAHARYVQDNRPSRAKVPA